jgi:hypothetical protein
VKAIFDILLGNSEIDDPLGQAAEAREPEGFDEHIEIIKITHHIGL